MHRWLIFLFIITLTAGCTCNSHSNGKGDNTRLQGSDTSLHKSRDSGLADTTASTPQTNPDHFDTATRHWVLKTLQKQQLQPGDFSVHAQKTISDTTSNTSGTQPELSDQGGEPGVLPAAQTFKIPDNYQDDYATILRWSPDSNYIVDLGSYGMVATKDANGKVHLEGGEPDTRVMLVDPKTSEQTQVLFGGPGLDVMDARWLSDSLFALLYANTVHHKPDTTLMLINIHSLETRSYGYQGHL